MFKKSVYKPSVILTIFWERSKAGMVGFKRNRELSVYWKEPLQQESKPRAHLHSDVSRKAFLEARQGAQDALWETRNALWSVWCIVWQLAPLSQLFPLTLRKTLCSCWFYISPFLETTTVWLPLYPNMNFY